MSQLPTGTVTFLFTDLEGSTRLWDEHPEAMRSTLARHDEILRDAMKRLRRLNSFVAMPALEGRALEELVDSVMRESVRALTNRAGKSRARAG